MNSSRALQRVGNIAILNLRQIPGFLKAMGRALLGATIPTGDSGAMVLLADRHGMGRECAG